MLETLQKYQNLEQEHQAQILEHQNKCLQYNTDITLLNDQLAKLTQNLDATSLQLNQTIQANQLLTQTNTSSENTIKDLTIDLEKKKAELIQLESTNQKLIGHNNIKQKVTHVVELKKQNNELQNVCKKKRN